MKNTCKRVCNMAVVRAVILCFLVVIAAGGCAGEAAGPATTLQLSASGGGELLPADIEATAVVIKKRLEMQPKVSRVTVKEAEGARLLVSFSGTVEEELLQNILTKPGYVTFAGPLEYSLSEGDDVPESTPVIIDGSEIKSSRINMNQYHQPAISIELNAESTVTFGKFTARNIGKYIAISIDGKVLSCPMIQGAVFGGSAQITGNFELPEATFISSAINSGSLKARVEIIEE